MRTMIRIVPKPADRIVAPLGAVWPRGQSAYHENYEDNKDEKTHVRPLPS